MRIHPRRRSRELSEGWELRDPVSGDWLPATVPGSVDEVVGDRPDLDEHDWVYRTTFAAAPDEELLIFEGLATVADVELDGAPVAHHETAFQPLLIPIGPGGGEHEVTVTFRALAPLLAAPRKPRARWRTALAAGNLRWYRTQLLGRTPGMAPSPALVGPYAPVRLAARTPLLTVNAHLNDDIGDLLLQLEPGIEAADVELLDPEGRFVCRLELESKIPNVVKWMPHTHGQPALYSLRLDGRVVARVGFRALSWRADWEDAGFALSVNGVSVFCRGVVWTPLEPGASAAELRSALEAVRDAGMNMVRVPGTARYEGDLFYDLCDELGILVWQDLMLANFDYPVADPGFAEVLRSEFSFQLERLAGRPSLAVVCGGSEVAQQVAMLGLDPELARGALYRELIPGAMKDAGVDAVYVPNSPWGTGLPFRPDRGVANYYGVGGYRRPFSDARLSEVKFAGECLALANLSDDAEVGAWVPKDASADWDFGDVRDHYLALIHRIDPATLRAEDPERYLALSRRVSGEVMSEVFGEWRRAGSACAGGLVLWSRDLRPGAGWGLWDQGGAPKPVVHHLRRALSAVAIWLTDEGLSGIAVHVANDRPEPLQAELRVAAYRDGATLVAQARTELELAAHAGWSADSETLLGRFLDINWSYRFGPPGVDLVVATLTGPDSLFRQAFRHPLGPPSARESAQELGLTVERNGRQVRLTAVRHLYGARLPAVEDDDFCLEPGGSRSLTLRHTGPAELRALNLSEPLSLPEDWRRQPSG